MTANANALRFALGRYGWAVQNEALRMTADGMREYAPIGTTDDMHRGETRRSIAASDVPDSTPQYRGTIVAPTPQARWSNDGTSPHPIDPIPPNRVLRFRGRGGVFVFARHVDHPGNAPGNWWEPGLRLVYPEMLHRAAQSFAGSFGSL